MEIKKVKEIILKLNPFGLFSCILSVRRFTHGRRWQGIEDFILIKKIQSGDTDAFEIIVRKYYQSIYLFCCRRLNGDPDTAADITQDVFLKLLENIQSVRKIGKFQNYLLTIAVNTCNNYTKKAKPLYMDALHTDSIIYSARYGRTKLTTSKIIAALEVVIGTYLLYLLLNLVLYGCTYGLQGWNVSIQSSLHYASSIYNLTFLQMFFISVILNILGIVALTTITLFLSAQMSSPVTALITSCVICFLPVVFDFNDSLPVLQKMQEICPIFMLHANGIFSDMKTYFGMSQPVFMIILNVGLIFVFYRLTKNISKKHQVTG